jgi:metal-dependent amidase/aminoacylase/carboxypeptidase family protein
MKGCAAMLKQVSQELFDYAVEIFHKLHMHPEIGFDLPVTTALVAAELEKAIRDNFDTLREMDSKISKPKKAAAPAAAAAEEKPAAPAVSLDVSADDFE